MSFCLWLPLPKDADRIFWDRRCTLLSIEPDRTVAFMLKFLVVLSAAAAVLHCTGLFGYGFF